MPILHPPQAGAYADQVLAQDAAIVRAIAHEDVGVGARRIARSRRSCARGDFDVNEAA